MGVCRGCRPFGSTIPYFRPPIPCLFMFLRTLLHLQKSQLFSFHGLAHSSRRNRGWGTPPQPRKWHSLEELRTRLAPVAASRHRPAPALSGSPVTSHESPVTLLFIPQSTG